MVGREAAAVATESGGKVATEPGGTVATESGGAGTTGDETVRRRPVGLCMRTKVRIQLTFAMLKRWLGTTQEAGDGDRVRRGRDGDETGDETGGPRDETHGHVMQNIIKILFYLIKNLFTNRFSQFLLQKIQQ